MFLGNVFLPNQLTHPHSPRNHRFRTDAPTKILQNKVEATTMATQNFMQTFKKSKSLKNLINQKLTIKHYYHAKQSLHLNSTKSKLNCLIFLPSIKIFELIFGRITLHTYDMINFPCVWDFKTNK